MFNDLPDEVAHRIIYRLSARAAARLSLVSRRLRLLCESSPVLTFENSGHGSDPASHASLVAYFDRLLIQRRAGASGTLQFVLKWLADRPSESGVDEEGRVLSWLSTAAQCQARDIVVSVRLRNGSDLALSLGLLCRNSVRTLSLRFWGGSAVVKTPVLDEPGRFSSLVNLIVQTVRLDEGFGGWVSRCCRRLKTLDLIDLIDTESFVVNSSSLEVLFVRAVDGRLSKLGVSADNLKIFCLDWKFDRSDDKELRLFAPRIKTLGLRGNVASKLLPENSLDSLSHVWIRLRPSNSSEYAIVVRLLRNFLSLVESFALEDAFIKCLHEEGDLPISFENLTSLCIGKTTSVDLVPALSSFFRGTPKLLHVYIGLAQRRYEMAEKKYQRIAESLRPIQNAPPLHNLKLMTIELIGSEDYENELGIIEYFLKNGNSLVKVQILCSDNDLVLDVSARIKGYEKASCDVEIVFSTLSEDDFKCSPPRLN